MRGPAVKGLSPAAAVLLMVLIALALVALLHSTLSGLSPGAAAERVLSGAAVVEGATVRGGELVVYVRNVGRAALAVDLVTVEREGRVIYALRPEGGRVGVEPGEVAEVRAELPGGLPAGRYTVRVHTTGGVQAARTVILGEAAAGWLPGWGYRRPVLIVEASGNELRGYQVRVVLTPDSFSYDKARADGGDLRFTDSDGATQLPYWIERWEPGGTSVVWVRVPEVPPLGEKVIYLYYGNPGAAGQGSGEEVFEFFDDFRELRSGVWGVEVGGEHYGVTVDVVGSAEFHDGRGLRVRGVYGLYGFANVYTERSWQAPASGVGYAVEARLSPRSKGINQFDARLSLYAPGASPGNHPRWAEAAQVVAVGGGCWGLGCWAWSFDGLRSPVWDDGGDKVYQRGGWYVVGVAYYGGDTAYWVLKEGPSGPEPYARKTYGGAHAGFRVVLGNHAEGLAMTPSVTVETWFDWVRVRRYVEPEPTVIVGEEERARG